MGLIFVDSSALVKRYIAEQGSAWVRAWIEPQHGNTIIIAEVAIPEVISTLARLQRQSFLSSRAFPRFRARFELAVEQEYFVIPVAAPIIRAASELVVRHPLHTLDALHLAAALESSRRFAQPPLFVSADQRLLSAAAAEGFLTDNPNNH
jgi:predicted nucleic acid-binding protein